MVDQMRGLLCDAGGRQMRRPPAWGLHWPCFLGHGKGLLRAQTTHGGEHEFRGCSMGGFEKTAQSMRNWAAPIQRSSSH